MNDKSSVKSSSYYAYSKIMYSLFALIIKYKGRKYVIFSQVFTYTNCHIEIV